MFEILFFYHLPDVMDPFGAKRGRGRFRDITRLSRNTETHELGRSFLTPQSVRKRCEP